MLFTPCAIPAQAKRNVGAIGRERRNSKGGVFPWRALESYPRDGSTLARCGVWILVLLAAVPVGTVCGCGRGQEKNGTSGEHLDGHFAGETR